MPKRVRASSTESLEIGQIGEVVCLLKLLRLGIPSNFAHLEKTDILSIHNKRPVRIQVKSTTWRLIDRRGKGRKERWGYHFSVCSGRTPKQPLTRDDCDIVALVAIDIDKVLFKNVELLAGRVTRKIDPKSFTENCEKESWNECVNRDEHL
ncbi:MAG: hypothetical protein CMD09_04730 [Flavobacteriales bacterium]|nr:hypothetical protein [Flavobacteriales bacterium]|tara:strand:+ start:210 stop:662 length:453 start_codon:yes stop_codon:yes gene_type:complete